MEIMDTEVLSTQQQTELLKRKWSNYSRVFENSKNIIFDEFGLLTNGKSRPKDLDYDATEALTSTCIAPIQIAQDIEGFCHYLKPHISSVAKRYNNGSGTGKLFQSYIERKGKGSFVYISPTKRILLKDCTVRLEKLKPRKVNSTKSSTSTLNPTDPLHQENVMTESKPSSSTLFKEETFIAPTVKEPQKCERDIKMQFIKEALRRTKELREKYSNVFAPYKNTGNDPPASLPPLPKLRQHFIHLRREKNSQEDAVLPRGFISKDSDQEDHVDLGSSCGMFSSSSSAPVDHNYAQAYKVTENVLGKSNKAEKNFVSRGLIENLFDWEVNSNFLDLINVSSTSEDFDDIPCDPCDAFVEVCDFKGTDFISMNFL